MGLKEFLVSTKTGLADLYSRPKIHIVIGNETCDLDSTVSAVIYAYFLQQTKFTPDTLYLPLMNIPREQFRLKLEVVYFLNKHDIMADDLVFVDDLDLVGLTQSQVSTLTVTLVDHHDLSEAEECLRKFVGEVLDHRPQNGILPASWNAHIERVGSCCTIIARKLLQVEAFTFDSTVAELLLGTILMDTGNMSASDGVGTPADQEVLDKLQTFLPPGSANNIYEGIRNAKSDLSSLTVLDMLYKDLKVLKGSQITVAMSSITTKLEDVLSRPEFSLHCEEFCLTLPADVLIIMTLWKDHTGLSQRRIAVYSLNRIYRDQISDVLLNSLSPNLELQPLTSHSHLEHVSAFVQNNIQVFRKGVMPLVREFLSGENTTPDENLNALGDYLQLYDEQLDSESPGEIGDMSEEEARRHINLAKTFQNEQFRTSQDRYDLAAVGMDAVISPSLSSDSEISEISMKKEGQDLLVNEVEDNGEKEVDNEGYELTGAQVGVKTYGAAFVNTTGAGDTGNIDALVDNKETAATGETAFMENLIDFGFGSNDVGAPAGENSPQTNVTSGLADLHGGSGDDLLFMNNSFDGLRGTEITEVGSDLVSISGLDVEVLSSKEGTVADLLGVNVVSVDSDTITDKHWDGDDIQDHSPLNLLGPESVDIPLDFPSMPTSNQTSGQGSKVSSYPETPPNSCMEPSSLALNKETQLPSFNSSEMVRRIQDKKAALAGHGRQKKAGDFDDEEALDGLFVGDDFGSGESSSVISPAVPQNSYVDLVSGFDFQSAGNRLPKLMNSDIMERVNEKRSQFEWSVESLEGSTSGVDVGPDSEEIEEKLPFGASGVQHILVNSNAEPQIPYTPQNSYVEEDFDSYARSNLPSLNNAEIVAKIKAKQSAMFGSGSSSRVSRSSHGSDDSGGCRSPDIVDKSPRGTSLDSPQAPYTPQNSYRDNLGVLDSRNHLPDLNEVAERLSTENALKHQFGKKSASNSGGGSRDEENINLNTHQPSHRRYGRNSSSQSDSQNTMSDVESLMSVSTDIGTPSENIVASVLASQMRNEIAMLSRKNTNDSDVFPTNKAEEPFIARDLQPKVSHIDLVRSEKLADIDGSGSAMDTTGIDNSDGVINNGYAETKELFSPFDNNKVLSMEDHLLFEAAEGIVARSVAAALQASHKLGDAGGQERRESKLRWSDDVESVEHVNHVDSENKQDYPSDGGSDDDDNDDSTTGDISESLQEIDLDKVVRNEGLASQEIAEEILAEPVSNSVLNNHSAQQGWNHEEVNNQGISQNLAFKNHLPQNEAPLSLEPDPGISFPGETADVPMGDQSLADLALNELAFELANELIHSVLDDFPFSQDLTAPPEDGATEVKHEKSDLGTDGVQETTKKIAQKIGLDNTSALETEEVNLAVLNVSGNNQDAVTSVEVPAGLGESDFGLSENTMTRPEEKISSNSISPAVDFDLNTRTFVDSKRYTDPSLDSLSTSLEKKHSKDTDSSMTILEDEIVATFPERKISTEFVAVEEDEEIQSFPGRKFSKSEDYPSRRFSRDETSSRMEDFDLEVTIGPEDIETDYLPNMDPLQGNLDIIDASYSKITDADREVVEGESFRKVSGEDFDSGEEEEDEEQVERGLERIKRDSYHSEDTNTFLTEDEIDKLVPEEDSGADSDNASKEIAERTEQLNQIETFAGFSNEHEIETSENSGLLEGPTQIKIQVTEDLDEFETQDEDFFNKTEKQTLDSEPESTESVEKSDKQVAEIPAEESGTELERQFSDVYTEPENSLLDSRVKQEEAVRAEEAKFQKQKKKIRVSFSEDFDDELGDFNITSSSRSLLKSPPPPPSTEDSGSSGSPSPVVPDEGETSPQAEVADEGEILPLKAAPTQWVPDERKEVYHTSAGRISIAMGEDEYRSSLSYDAEASPEGSPFTDQVTANERAQMGEVIHSVETFPEVDHIPEHFDGPAHAFTATNLDSVDASQPELTLNALQPMHVEITPEHESNPALDIVTFEPNVETCDPLNSDLSTVNSNPVNEPSVSDNYNQDPHSELMTSEASSVTFHPLSQSHQVPASISESISEPLSADPFISVPTHVRSLSSASTGSVQAAVYSDEWQDDDIVDVAAQSGLEVAPDDLLRKKIAPEPSFAESAVADDVENEENINKKEEDEDSDAGDLEWENDTPVKTPTRPGIEPILAGESTSQGVQRWKRVSVSGSDFDIDMQAVEPFRNVLSHGGYYDEGLSAIIVFYGCNLPSHHCKDYAYIMNHLFHYVIHTLEELVADDYVIIYFHGSTPRRQTPSLGWLKRCYQSIDRRLKKNLKGLFLVHPTLWLRTIVMMLKPFISAKFSSKLRFVRTLEELNSLVPLNNVSIPVAIVHYDIHHQHLPSLQASPSDSPTS